MTERAAALAAEFGALNDEIAALVTGCSPEQWRQQCATEGWPVAVVAHHIAVVHQDLARLVEALAAGERRSPAMTMEEVDASNARHADAYAAVDKQTTLKVLRANGNALLVLLSSFADDHLDHSAGVFGGQELKVAQVLEWIVIGHARVHLASIRATIAS